MNRTKGFTLIELLIVVAIIVILVVTFAGLLKPRKAGAHELFPTELRTELTAKAVGYRWSPADHTLLIIDKGTADWADARAACAALSAIAPDVTPLTVTMSGVDTSGTASLTWEGGSEVRKGADVATENAHGAPPKLTNLPTTDSVTC